MSAPQPRGKRGHRQWKGVSEGRRASTLMMNADVDEPPGLTRVENRGIGKTGPGRSGSGRRSAAYLSHARPFRISLFYRRFLNGSSLVNSSAISASGNCCLNCSQHTAPTTRPRLQYSESLVTYPQSMDRGDLAAVTLLDISAAFDTVDLAMLIHRLESHPHYTVHWLTLFDYN